MSIRFSRLLSQVSKSHQTLSNTKQLHAFLTTTNLTQYPFYVTKLVRFYAQNGDVLSARHLFDKTPQRSIFLWNSIIRAYAQANKFNHDLLLFTRMIEAQTMPDNFTFACLIRGCYENFDLKALRILHGRVLISGLEFDSVCCSALVSAYSKMGFFVAANEVFCGVFEPDLALWNCMIFGCSYCGFWDKGLRFFNEMRAVGLGKIDGYSLVGLISGLVSSSLLGIGQCVHGLCLRSGFDCNVHVGSALVSMYSRFRCMNSAYGVFNSIRELDLIAWSALINGYSQSGDSKKALFFFRNLNVKGEKGDPVLIAGVLVAVAQLANVGAGAEIHGYVIRHGYEMDVRVSSSLVDMYSKCGSLGLGIRVFDNMSNRNIVSYNSIISGLGLHGLASQAFKMFEEMLAKRLKPDESTFSALLSTCCHAGLVKAGWDIFRRMKDDFCVEPRTEHYVYIIKLFGMTGELKEAYNLILSMKKPVDSGIWGALLSCCDSNGNSELAEIVAQHLFDDDPKKGAYRVMLSNVYAGNERWNDVKEMRDDMKVLEVSKMPGFSWIGGSCT